MRKRALALGFSVILVVLVVVSTGSAGDSRDPFPDGTAPPTVTQLITLAEQLRVVPSIDRGLLQALPSAGSREGQQRSGDVYSQLVNTPAPPTGSTGVSPSAGRDQGSALSQVSPTISIRPPEAQSPAGSSEEDIRADAAHGSRDQDFARLLREAGARVEIAEPEFEPAGGPSAQSPSATCVNVLLNPQMDVVEFGDGTGSIEHWSILYQAVCYDPGTYSSANHSVVLSDGPCSGNPDETYRYNDFYEDWMEYDSFGQGFQAPNGLTYVYFSYMKASADVNEDDWAGSQLWTVDSEGYLDEYVVGFFVGESPGVWDDGWWDLTQADDADHLADLSGKTLALVFYLWGDDLAPNEWLWLDDAQLQLCYERGTNTVYLPVVAKRQGESSGPTCAPREPDDVKHQGTTTVGSTCAGSFSNFDEKDYYSLNLDGATKVRLRLFNLPSGTNWDAMIYEDAGGGNYPLACHIGTQGWEDKSADCPNADGYPNSLNLSKDYFVLVSRGPEKDGGPYTMSVERR